jgi:hypothetical protein
MNTLSFIYIWGVPISLTLVTSIGLIKNRKNIIAYIKIRQRKRNTKKYGRFVDLAERFCLLFRSISKHKQRPYYINPLLKAYRKKVYEIIKQLNKIALVYDRVCSVSVETSSESFLYIKNVYTSLQNRINKEAVSLSELYSLCERKTVDIILLNTEKYNYDAKIRGLVESMNEIDKIYSIDLLNEHLMDYERIESLNHEERDNSSRQTLTL